VPDPVTGLPVTVNIFGRVNPTLLTPPEAPTADHEFEELQYFNIAGAVDLLINNSNTEALHVTGSISPVLIVAVYVEFEKSTNPRFCRLPLTTVVCAYDALMKISTNANRFIILLIEMTK
jgi:hypothetical protein